MGKRGPAKTPTALRVLHGEKVDTTEPVPSMAEVVAPDWLDPEAADVWARLAPDLEARGVLTAWDVDAFAVFCDAVARHRQAARLVAASGPLVKGDKGRVVKNPAAQLVRDYAALMTTYGGRFGLTPSDRAQLAVGGPGGARAGAGPERLLG